MTAPPAPAAARPDTWVEVCARCGRTFPLAASVWRCECGGLLDLTGPPPDRLLGDPDRWSMWRYLPTLPPVAGWEAVTLGEGMTPAVPLPGGAVGKLEYLNPTLSFKDRGAAVLVAAMAGRGVRRAVTDSSGNAGTALAAYATRAGIDVEVFVPGGTSAKKTAAMRAHGAEVRVVDGDRADAARAAAARVEETGAFYASHVYQPLFVQGTKTVVLELWEQLGGRLPATLVLPAGNGTLVLGADLALRDLTDLGLIEGGPRIVAVQARSCAPLAGLAPTGPTVAEGIAIATPPRAAEVAAALERWEGTVVTVDDDEILAARRDLSGRGLWVEPTAAVSWAAWRTGAATGEPITGEPLTGEPMDAASVRAAVLLCGAGLKSP